MSARPEAIVSDKQVLLDRSALTRLQLRHRSRDVGKALRWPVAVVAAGPMVRFVALASRVLLYARLVRSVVAFARTATGRP